MLTTSVRSLQMFVSFSDQEGTAGAERSPGLLQIIDGCLALLDTVLAENLIEKYVYYDSF